MHSFKAHYDGKHICPDEPVTLPTDIELRVTVHDIGPHKGTYVDCRPDELFDSLEADAGLHEGPTDLAAEHDHYLYGAPKKNDGTK